MIPPAPADMGDRLAASEGRLAELERNTRRQPTLNLRDLADARLWDVADGEVAVYRKASGQWEPETPILSPAVAGAPGTLLMKVTGTPGYRWTTNAEVFFNADHIAIVNNITPPGGSGVLLSYAGSTPNSGPAIRWYSSLTSQLGLYVQSGLYFQGDAGNPSFGVRVRTGTGSLGAVAVKLGGDSATDTSYFNAGNVGIGLTGPEFQFHVQKTGGDAIERIDTVTSGSPILQITTRGQQDWCLGVDRSDSGKFKVARSTALATNTHLTIDTSGNVGINGTPNSKLHVFQDANNYLRFPYGGGDTSGLLEIVGNQAGHAVGLWLRATTSGRAYRLVSYSGTLGAGNGGFVIRDDTAVADRLTIDASGNVGIGVSPLYKIDVAGEARCRTSLFIDNTGVTESVNESWILADSAGVTGEPRMCFVGPVTTSGHARPVLELSKTVAGSVVACIDVYNDLGTSGGYGPGAGDKKSMHLRLNGGDQVNSSFSTACFRLVTTSIRTAMGFQNSSTSALVQLDSSNGFRFRNGADTANVALEASAFNVVSVRASKRQVRYLGPRAAMSGRLAMMRPVRFKRRPTPDNDGNPIHQRYSENDVLGLVAEDLADVLPEALSWDEDGNPAAIDYAVVTAALVQGFKELSEEIKKVKGASA